MLVVGAASGIAFVAMSIGALEGIEERDAGLASGLTNTTQQVGGALGVAVLSTLALTRTDELLDPTDPTAVALTEGFQIALTAGAAFAAVGALAALGLIRGKPKPQPAGDEATPSLLLPAPSRRRHGHGESRPAPSFPLEPTRPSGPQEAAPIGTRSQDTRTASTLPPRACLPYSWMERR